MRHEPDGRRPVRPRVRQPSKFIGASYDKGEAQALTARLGCHAVDGSRWRRVVASPRPLGLAEIDTVRSLADAGAFVVCGGGGGVPVVRSNVGELTGVEAVVDKDLTAAELAITLKADRLLVLTDVPAIIRGYGTPGARPSSAVTMETTHYPYQPSRVRTASPAEPRSGEIRAARQ